MILKFYNFNLRFIIQSQHIVDGDGLLVNEDFTTVGSWCSGRDDTFLVGDTNGDHNDDWICHHGDGSVCTKYNALIFGGERILVLQYRSIR